MHRNTSFLEPFCLFVWVVQFVLEVFSEAKRIANVQDVQFFVSQQATHECRPDRDLLYQIVVFERVFEVVDLNLDLV